MWLWIHFFPDWPRLLAIVIPGYPVYFCSVQLGRFMGYANPYQFGKSFGQLDILKLLPKKSIPTRFQVGLFRKSEYYCLTFDDVIKVIREKRRSRGFNYTDSRLEMMRCKWTDGAARVRQIPTRRSLPFRSKDSPVMFFYDFKIDNKRTDNELVYAPAFVKKYTLLLEPMFSESRKKYMEASDSQELMDSSPSTLRVSMNFSEEPMETPQPSAPQEPMETPRSSAPQKPMETPQSSAPQKPMKTPQTPKSRFPTPQEQDLLPLKYPQTPKPSAPTPQKPMKISQTPKLRSPQEQDLLPLEYPQTPQPRSPTPQELMTPKPTSPTPPLEYPPTQPNTMNILSNVRIQQEMDSSPRLVPQSSNLYIKPLILERAPGKIYIEIDGRSHEYFKSEDYN